MQNGALYAISRGVSINISTDQNMAMLQLYEVAWTKGELDALNDVMSDSHIQKDMLHPGSSSEGRQGIQRGITRCVVHN